MRTILFFFLPFIIGVNAISKYDFNACRISSCNSEEQNCLAEEAGCLNYFATMRNCFASCQNVYDYFNPCWKDCKNTAARTNTHWLSLSLCYENVCYVHEPWVIFLLSIALLLSLL